MREFGFTIENREIIVDDIRVRGIGKSVIKEEETIAQNEGNPAAETVSSLFLNNLCFTSVTINFTASETVFKLSILLIQLDVQSFLMQDGLYH